MPDYGIDMWWLRPRQQGPDGFIQGAQLGLQIKQQRFNQTLQMAEFQMAQKRQELDEKLADVKFQSAQMDLENQKLEADDLKTFMFSQQEVKAGRIPSPTFNTPKGIDAWERYTLQNETLSARRNSQRAMQKAYASIVETETWAGPMIDQYKPYSPEWANAIQQAQDVAEQRQIAKRQFESGLIQQRQVAVETIRSDTRKYIEDIKTELRNKNLLSNDLTKSQALVYKTAMEGLRAKLMKDEITGAEYDRQAKEIAEETGVENSLPGSTISGDPLGLFK